MAKTAKQLAAEKAAAEKAAAEKAAAEKAAAEKAAAEKEAAEKEAAEKAKVDAEAQALAEATKATGKVPALRVSAKREGFRRGGRAWGKEATTVKLSELSDEQIAQIKGETAMLTVEEVEVDE